MAFPSTGVLDAFTRTDAADLGSGWSANPFNNGATSPRVSSNQAVGQSATFAFDLVWWNAGTVGPDTEVFVSLPTIGTSGAGSEAYLIARVQSPSSSSSTGDGYWMEWLGNATLRFKRLDNGVATVLGASQTLGALSNGDGLGFEVVGSTLQAYKRVAGVWSAHGSSRSDTTYTAAGYIGFGGYEDTRTQAFDDFSGGTVIVPSPYSPPVAAPGQRRHQHLLIR